MQWTLFFNVVYHYRFSIYWFCYGVGPVDFTHILQGYFDDIIAMIVQETIGPFY